MQRRVVSVLLVVVVVELSENVQRSPVLSCPRPQVAESVGNCFVVSSCFMIKVCSGRGSTLKRTAEKELKYE